MHICIDDDHTTLTPWWRRAKQKPLSVAGGLLQISMCEAENNILQGDSRSRSGPLLSRFVMASMAFQSSCLSVMSFTTTTGFCFWQGRWRWFFILCYVKYFVEIFFFAWYNHVKHEVSDNLFLLLSVLYFFFMHVLIFFFRTHREKSSLKFGSKQLYLQRIFKPICCERKRQLSCWFTVVDLHNSFLVNRKDWWCWPIFAFFWAHTAGPVSRQNVLVKMMNWIVPFVKWEFGRNGKNNWNQRVICCCT